MYIFGLHLLHLVLFAAWWLLMIIAAFPWRKG